jgi:formylglycine-generating enzyme required for sulfatase activity
MRCLWILVLGLILSSLTRADALAERRVALVIGNGAYRNAPTLPNPPHDAEDVAAALKRRTVPVDSFAPNPFGLYSVHGNVWQWVEDCFAYGYEGALADGSAKTAGDCGSRVFRGGSWGEFPTYLHAAYRNWNNPELRDGVGFRLARTIAP